MCLLYIIVVTISNEMKKKHKKNALSRQFHIPIEKSLKNAKSIHLIHTNA